LRFNIQPVVLDDFQRTDSQEGTPAAEDGVAAPTPTAKAGVAVTLASSDGGTSLSPQSTVSSSTSQPPPSVETITTSIEPNKQPAEDTTSSAGSGEPLASATEQQGKDER